MKPTPSVLYLFPHSTQATRADIEAGKAPTERMYGVIELRKRGFRVDICDSRFEGMFGKFCSRLRKYGIFLVDWNTVRAISRHDVIIVKDDFSIMTSLAARLLRKKLVYIDAMFSLPRSWRRRLAARISIGLSDVVVAYSRSQIALWSARMGVPAGRFRFFPYAVDTEFYKPVQPDAPTQRYVLAVGRDLGRDFATLVEAVRGTGLRLVLVTLPYLLPANADRESHVDLKQRVSYEELFRLYAGSSAVVVPLKPSIFYPSGIRAVFEAALLGRPVVATRTPVLEEYLEADAEVIYVEAGDAVQLRARILALVDDPAASAAMQDRARRRTFEQYSMDAFADQLAGEIRRLTA